MTKVSLHRFAELPRRFLLALGLGIGILTVGAISPPPALEQPDEPLSPPATQTFLKNLPLLLNQSEVFWESAKMQAPGVETVTLYTPTATCDDYQGETRTVTTEAAIPEIVRVLLTEQTPNLLDFELAGYRVQAEEMGQSVTIDFRRKPGAQRYFISLSMCEQLVLFGSLRKTLLENPNLNIQAVYFTERGVPIQL